MSYVIEFLYIYQTVQVQRCRSSSSIWLDVVTSVSFYCYFFLVLNFRAYTSVITKQHKLVAQKMRIRKSTVFYKVLLKKLTRCRFRVHWLFINKNCCKFYQSESNRTNLDDVLTLFNQVTLKSRVSFFQLTLQWSCERKLIYINTHFTPEIHSYNSMLIKNYVTELCYCFNSYKNTFTSYIV